MAAGDHLGTQFTPGKIPAPDQYMPTTQLMKATSGDFGGLSMGYVFDHEYTHRTNLSSMGVRRPYNWDRLRNEVGEHGIKNPVRISQAEGEDPMVTDGHHRSMMAIEQGHLFVPVKHYDEPHEYWMDSAHKSENQDTYH